MATSKVVRQAIEEAVDSAKVDRSAPEGEWVAFDPATLDRIKSLMKESGGEERVRDAWRLVIREAINGLEGDRSLAALVLSDRLRGAPARAYVQAADGSWIPPSATGDPAEDFWFVVGY
jgi:hypothetical protein